MGAMDSLLARLDHARSHAECLDIEVNRFLDLNPVILSTEHKPEAGEWLLWAEPDPTKPIPGALGFIAGDCIHNLRSVLDNLVCALPGAVQENAAFPILEKDPAPKTFAKAAWRLDGIPQAAIDLIETLQPYQGSQRAYRANVPVGTLLLWLNKLWNMDKHRSSIVTLSGTLGGNVALLRNKGWTLIEYNGGALNGRQVIARFQRTGDLRGQTEFEAEIPYDVVFEYFPGTVLRASGMLEQLHDCIRYDVLPLFDPFF